MKKIYNIIKENFFLSIIFGVLFFIFMMSGMFIVFIAPFFIIKIFFGYDFMSEYKLLIIFIFILWDFMLLYFIDDKTDKIPDICCIVGLFSFSVFILNNYFESSPKKSVSSVPTVSYTPRIDYSSRDSHTNLNYRSSEPSNYTPPAKNSDDVTISHAPLPKNEKISENESSIPSNYDEDTQKIDIKHENEENHSTSSEIGLYDSWEYVTSDEYGNKYYINRNFGIYNTTTSFEGTIFYALFRKVFNNGGREVEVPTYDINKGMITEKKILAYEESIIRFRNENGLKEINFSSITGYTADNSVIIGYEIDNDDNIFRWKTINSEVYSALYDYVISR